MTRNRGYDRINDAIEQILNAEAFVYMAFTGLGWATCVLEALDADADIRQRAGNPIPEATLVRFRRKSEFAKSFGDDQDSKGFPYLFGLVAIQLWGILESAVDDFTVAHLMQPGDYAASELVARLTAPVIQTLNSTPEELAEKLLVELKYAAKTASKIGVARFESILHPLGLSNDVNTTVRRVLLELSQVRNILVHKGGVADSRFIANCPWFGAGVGQQILLNQRHFEKYKLAAHWYRLRLWLHAVNDKEHEDLRESIELHLKEISTQLDNLV